MTSRTAAPHPTTLTTAALATALTLSCALALRPAPASAAGEIPARDFVLRAGTLITMTGDDLSPGVLVVRSGRIAAVGGPDLSVPSSLPVVDVGDRVVMPGFIEAHSQRGLDRTYERVADASFVRISDALNPVTLEIEDARRNGITTLLVAPDDQAFLGGRAAIIHPQGVSVESMIVQQDAALKISLMPSSGESRMGHLAKLRKILDTVRRERADEKAEKRRHARRDEAQAKDDSKTRRREALVALLEDRMPAIVYCGTAADVSTAFALAREYGFRMTPVVAPEAWRAAKLLRENGVRVILTPRTETWETQPDGSVLHVDLPKVLADHGVPFAMTTDPRELGAQHPWYQAALAVRAGVPRETALASITKVPAQVLGFGSRKGVLAEGSDADFVVLSDDPLSGAAWVDESYVRGTRIYSRDVDEKLKRLLSRTDEPPLTAAETDHVDEDRVGPGPREEPGDAERRARWPLPVGDGA